MPKRRMVVNYLPGEECRVAVVEDGKLEELHSERADAVSHVGNIYIGTVVNVEPAIQAAFVDFGLEQSGFLHVSDLHPRYFPGEGGETTERVGKKTPRRERPPIQECLRRGQEIAVQVLKEGVGTKGPTLTSYLSIPGRFLVMMPLMDNVGVSRKVEDEETRRKMREILDQLELPEGFGFILRTAGLERTKAEIKRDLAYLQRLWKDMEKRWGPGANKRIAKRGRRGRGRGEGGGGDTGEREIGADGKRSRLLYSESDLLVRALRDMLSGDIDQIVIDNESALKRAAGFLKIVAPRSAANLLHYTGSTPIFHAMGIEQQIRNIHAREVPLPSGGRLVIDETEALVAIDVNSGKMRDARDAETNAYRTNLEAVDEICRQLRLRDLGGIVVNDLIDMRSMKHRREIEHLFQENLKKDRARSTIAPISPFGILELTRQRMRGSHESVHFGDCPVCRGRGLVQKPDSVAADAMRELATLLQYERVARVEMVVSPRTAGELLSAKRRTLNRLERQAGKHVDVRISEAIPVDRVTFYAYDERGSDIDTSKLPAPRVRDEELRRWEQAVAPGEDWAVDLEGEAAQAAAQEPEPPEPEPETAPEFLGVDFDEVEHQEAPAPLPGEDGRGKRRRRRRGRGGRGQDGQAADGEAAGRPQPGRRGDEGGVPGTAVETAEPREAEELVQASTDAGSQEIDGLIPAGPGREEGRTGEAPGQERPEGEGGRRRRGRRRRRRGGGGGGGPDGAEAVPRPADADTHPGEPVEAAPPDRRNGRMEPDRGSAEARADAGRPDAGGHGEPPSSADRAEGTEEQRRRRRRRRRGGAGGAGGAAGAAPREETGGATERVEAGPAESGEPRRNDRRGRGRHPDGPPPRSPRAPRADRAAPLTTPRAAPAPRQVPEAATPPAPKGPRTLYSASRRKLTPSERAKLGKKKPE